MANTNAIGKLCIRLATHVRKVMSQPSAGETLAAYSAESEINVRSMAAFTILMKFEPSVADGFQLLTITLVKSRTPRGFVWEDVKKSFRRSSMRPRATF